MCFLAIKNEDGLWSEPEELVLIFRPKWYQTLWFKALIGLAIITIGYSLYRMLISRIRKEQHIRSKLASALHDDLGSTMNSVKVYTNLAMMRKQSDKYLLKINEATQEAILVIRDTIWVLDDRKDTLEALFFRINIFASPLCEGNNIQYNQCFLNNARGCELKREEKKNLYMTLKECVNNAVKYAQGKNHSIVVTLEKKKPIIIVKDDGKGFGTNLKSEVNGLRNMRHRAKEIKYMFSIESSHGNGAIFRFEKI